MIVDAQKPISCKFVNGAYLMEVSMRQLVYGSSYERAYRERQAHVEHKARVRHDMGIEEDTDEAGCSSSTL